MLWFTTHEMNVKSDYINWACCQIVTFLLFNCLPSLSWSLTSHIFSPTSRFACLVFLYAVLHNWLFSKFPQTAWSRWGSRDAKCRHVLAVSMYNCLYFLPQWDKNAKSENCQRTQRAVSLSLCTIIYAITAIIDTYSIDYLKQLIIPCIRISPVVPQLF